MDINTTLFNGIQDYLYNYDCNPNEIKHFLLPPSPESFLKKQKEAIKIIEGIMIVHGKRELLCHVTELAKIEHAIRELEPWARDHVVHALLSFILGIYLNERFLSLSNDSVNDFQWKLAGMFHDVGYPAQIAKDIILRPFMAKINDIKKNLGISAQDVYFKVVPIGLEDLTNALNSLDLIQKRLDEWKLQINAKKEYKRAINCSHICHGMMSSLALLKVIDFMYQKYNSERKYINILKDNVNFNQKYFEQDVVSACSAIYIHNLPSRCFADAKIDRSRAPLAFLLKLSDCLQEWERPSSANITGFGSSFFDIRVDDKQLIFTAKISDDRKKKIKEEISSYLIARDVQIC